MDTDFNDGRIYLFQNTIDFYRYTYAWPESRDSRLNIEFNIITKSSQPTNHPTAAAAALVSQSFWLPHSFIFSPKSVGCSSVFEMGNILKLFFFVLRNNIYYTYGLICKMDGG
jgi:hypothetical protein